MSEPRRVAVACQGGGSHTAYTAGALRVVLRNQARRPPGSHPDAGGSVDRAVDGVAPDADEPPAVETDLDYRVTALSGTSGGAFCAFLAWYGLQVGDGDHAARLLGAFWDDLAASDPVDAATNLGVVTARHLRESGAPLPQASPHHVPGGRIGRARLERSLRRLTVDRDGAPSIDDLRGRGDPRLVVSAVDVERGRFETFSDTAVRTPDAGADATPGGAGTGVGAAATRRTDGAGGGDEASDDGTDDEREAGLAGTGLDDEFDVSPLPLTWNALVASAAVPTLFEAVDVEGADGTRRPHWDGLLSQNPPLRNLVHDPDLDVRPDEIWLVRVNPEEREETPTSLAEIADRRNELVGNLSVRQELHFVERVNHWVATGALTGDYEPVVVRQLSLADELDGGAALSAASKLDRRPGLLDDLRAAGRSSAADFLREPEAERYRLLDPGGRV
jgi:NTE family protein